MKIQIEKQIEVVTEKTISGLNAIIKTALKSKSINNFQEAIQPLKEISTKDFFIYFGGSHVAVHEVLPNGMADNGRLLCITL